MLIYHTRVCFSIFSASIHTKSVLRPSLLFLYPYLVYYMCFRIDDYTGQDPCSFLRNIMPDRQLVEETFDDLRFTDSEYAFFEAGHPGVRNILGSARQHLLVICLRSEERRVGIECRSER